MISRLSLFCILSLLALPLPAQAVLPPDLLFSIGSQFAQFFSFFALVIGGLISTLLILLRSGLLSVKKYVLPIVLTLIVLLSLGAGGFALYETQRLEKEYQALLGAYTVDTSRPDQPGQSAIEENKEFYSNTLILYSLRDGVPFYLELDMNRKESPMSMYAHYYFSFISDADLERADYAAQNLNLPDITPQGVLTDFEVNRFPDFSTRERVEAELEIGDRDYGIEIESAQADFITKNSPYYLRWHSPTTAVLTAGEDTFETYALYEAVFTPEYGREVLLEGYEIESKNHQFVLWTESGDFYLIDRSDVTKGMGVYPSHQWTIYKSPVTGAQKGFKADIVYEFDDQGREDSWQVVLPDLGNVEIILDLDHYLETNGIQEYRQRALVNGFITTDKVINEPISGFVYIQEL